MQQESYTIGGGGDWKTAAVALKTTEADLKKANPNIKYLRPGVVVSIPKPKQTQNKPTIKSVSSDLNRGSPIQRNQTFSLPRFLGNAYQNTARFLGNIMPATAVSNPFYSGLAALYRPTPNPGYGQNLMRNRTYSATNTEQQNQMRNRTYSTGAKPFDYTKPYYNDLYDPMIDFYKQWGFGPGPWPNPAASVKSPEPSESPIDYGDWYDYRGGYSGGGGGGRSGGGGYSYTPQPPEFSWGLVNWRW